MKIKVTFEIERPEGKFTDEQMSEWMRFKLGEAATISADNPLGRHRLQLVGKLVMGEPAPRKGKLPEAAPP